MPADIIVPTVPFCDDLVSELKGITDAERVLLLTINRFDRISRCKNNGAGCFMSIEELSHKICKTHRATKHLLAKLRKAGLLIDLGYKKAGSTLRRRVALPKSHVEAFHARRETKKKKLWEAPNAVDTSLSPGELRKSFSSSTKEEISEEVTCPTPDTATREEMSANRIEEKKEIQRNPPGRDSSDTFSSPKPNARAAYVPKAKSHKKRDWLGAIKTFAFFPVLETRFKSLNDGDYQTIVKRIESGKLCPGEFGFVLELLPWLNSEPNPAYPHEPYRPKTLRQLLKKFDLMLNHLVEFKRVDVSSVTRSVEDEIGIAHMQLQHALERTQRGHIHDPVGEETTLGLFNLYDFMLDVKLMGRDAKQFLESLNPQRVEKLREDIKENSFGVLMVARAVGVDLISAFGAEFYTDVLNKRGAEKQHVEQCRQVLENPSLWTPGIFNDL